MSAVGPMLKAGRKSKGFTQREIADGFGIDFTYVSKIESDNQRFAPSDKLLMSFARLYELDIDDVFIAAGKCSPDLIDRLSWDREFVRRVRELVK